MSSRSGQVFRSRDAAEDLVSLWQFGAEEWSPERADQHLREIDALCDRLLDEPELGRTRDELLHGMRSFPMPPHILFYTQSSAGIYLVRVMHERSDVDTAFASLKL